MAHDASQIPWTHDQWAHIEDVIQQEAKSARVAATFLPLFGPLPADADFVRNETINDGRRGGLLVPARSATINDRNTIQLATLQVRTEMRSAQIADPELSSALQLFRRAANVVARLEDVVVFRGLVPAPGPPPGFMPPAGMGPPGNWQINGGQITPGLWSGAGTGPVSVAGLAGATLGDQVVTGVSMAILLLEAAGHFGPFAAVLDNGGFFNAVQSPAPSLVLPQDRLIPFLGGGPLLRSSALDPNTGVVVALGGAPVDLVVARDMSVNFLTTTTAPAFVFRVYEKIVLRIKQPAAICTLTI
jgi:uncharacterized linocin/CFP29 family protein